MQITPTDIEGVYELFLEISKLQFIACSLAVIPFGERAKYQVRFRI